MKLASRLIDLISKKKKKTNCPCSTLFLLISKKQICTWRAACSFVFPLPLFCTPTTLFCTNKSQTSLLHIIFKEELSYVLTQYFVSCVHAFSPCWPLVFVIFSRPPWCSMFFFLRNWFPLFSITRSSSFSVIHVSVNIKKKKTRKRHDFVVVFSF